VEQVTAGKLYNSLRRRETRGVVVAYGDEPYFRRKALKELERFASNEGVSDFDKEVFFGDRAEPKKFISSLRSAPFLGSMRLVVLKNYDKARKDLRDMVEAYMRAPTPSTLLFIDSKYWKHEEGYVTVVPCLVLDKRKKKSWVRRYLKDAGMEYDKNIVQVVSSMLSGTLGAMERDLDVLRKYLGRRKLTPEAAAEVLGDMRVTYRDLIQAFRAQDQEAFYKAASFMRDVGVATRAMFVVLTREALLVKRSLALEEEGVAIYDIAEDVGVPTYFLKDLFLYKRKWEKVDPVVILEALSWGNREMLGSGNSLVPLYELFARMFKHDNGKHV